jgi:hypothetical protein
VGPRISGTCGFRDFWSQLDVEALIHVFDYLLVHLYLRLSRITASEFIRAIVSWPLETRQQIRERMDFPLWERNLTFKQSSRVIMSQAPKCA